MAMMVRHLWLFPARYTHGDLVMAMGFYAPAKIFEVTDQQIFNLGHIISGRTLKHLTAGTGVYWIFRMLACRRAVVPG